MSSLGASIPPSAPLPGILFVDWLPPGEACLGIGRRRHGRDWAGENQALESEPEPEPEEPLWGPCRTSSSALRSVCIMFMLGQEVGPTMVGDEHSDPNLMNYLGATKRNMLGNHFWEYYVQDAPRIVLDKLEKCGYRVISMTGVGQTLVWCLHKECTENSDFLPNQNIAVNHPA
ncbi:hypothetical protein JD844_021245 [Phrynosoma platyrhinos]|uniref:GTP cyclohydrolase 1 feedback regulatory protein n=1 Tax=Phrynosoma platyrhinos TaxID=52577 RepID=A0ABQ7SU48_PHRPL|nr:hypothetical protein JD844_021245 [Phrynosoma platyrhinos]